MSSTFLTLRVQCLCQQLFLRPTRITDTWCTLIDIIFVSNMNNFKSEGSTADIYADFHMYIIYYKYISSDETQFTKIEHRTVRYSTLNDFLWGSCYTGNR